MMRQLLFKTITETKKFLSVVDFLKCVATKVLFSIVAFTTLTFRDCTR